MDDSNWLTVMSDVLVATVTEVVADVAAVVLDTDPRAGHIARATLTSIDVVGRRAGIRAATTGWVDLTLFGHRVSAIIFDYDEDVAELQKEIRALALVAHEYLTGGGRVVEQRGWFRAREVVVIDTVDGEWVLGYRSSRNPRGL
ncbi:hypothetical protein EUA06_09195 [Nocardioides glacieisoli]|uniref:Uncharacterized protein n=1 Tax=Nocardioides glacieisoli TaxID=1168730 RepID=A0A4Q2RRE5_9ACTN|nr:hypothetical protein [Nocardioides glacieisoli]RYB91487.1 hypothetical protein EUA06_09195 [Nocardioides glacieisoli]